MSKVYNPYTNTYLDDQKGLTYSKAKQNNDTVSEQDLDNDDFSVNYSMSREQLLLKLTALDFMAVDLHLYLDTHPNDKEALAKYNATIQEAEPLRDEYQKRYGPLYSYRSPSKYPWQWVKGDWPSLKEFNFELVAGRD